MDDTRKKLLAGLAELHNELKDAQDLEKPVMDALLEVAADIRALAERRDSEGAGLAGDVEQHSFLSEQVAKFETNHPAATRFLSQLTELLGSIGI